MCSRLFLSSIKTTSIDLFFLSFTGDSLSFALSLSSIKYSHVQIHRLLHSLSLFFWRARSVCYSIFCFSQETNELYHEIILCVCVCCSFIYFLLFLYTSFVWLEKKIINEQINQLQFVKHILSHTLLI